MRIKARFKLNFLPLQHVGNRNKSNPFKDQLDTPLSSDDLFRIFSGAIEKKGGIDKTWVYSRILNTFNWYTVLKIIPKDELPFLLSDKVINNLFPRQLRNKYRHVRNALFE